MKEIVNRLHENRQIELAKSILESHGYTVEKKINEAVDHHEGWEYQDAVAGSVDAGPSESAYYHKTIDGADCYIYPPQGEYKDYLAQIDDPSNPHEMMNNSTTFKDAEIWILSKLGKR